MKQEIGRREKIMSITARRNKERGGGKEEEKRRREKRKNAVNIARRSRERGREERGVQESKR